MTKEIWILRHGSLIKHPRFKENLYDTPLDSKAYNNIIKSTNDLIKNSIQLRNNKIKYIYCSPYKKCIQTAIQVIKTIKEKLNYDLKIIVVFNLIEKFNYFPVLNFKKNKLEKLIPNNNCLKHFNKMQKNLYNFKSLTIKEFNQDLRKQLKKDEYTKYIKKIIGSDNKLESNDEFIKNIAKTIIKINKKEKESYIIIGTFNTSILAYKYYNQNNENLPFIKDNIPPDWAIHQYNNKYCNLLMGFKKKEDNYKMIYKPKYEF